MSVLRASLIFCLLLGGCGYQLRGSDYWASMPSLAIAEVAQPSLKAAQEALVSSVRVGPLSEPTYTVELIDETYQKWPIAASPLDAVINYRVTLRWSVEVFGPEVNGSSHRVRRRQIALLSSVVICLLRVRPRSEGSISCGTRWETNWFGKLVNGSLIWQSVCRPAEVRSYEDLPRQARSTLRKIVDAPVLGIR